MSTVSCLKPVCISSFMKPLFRLLPIFLLYCLYFLCWFLKLLLYSLSLLSPYGRTWVGEYMCYSFTGECSPKEKGWIVRVKLIKWCITEQAASSCDGLLNLRRLFHKGSNLPLKTFHCRRERGNTYQPVSSSFWLKAHAQSVNFLTLLGCICMGTE